MPQNPSSKVLQDSYSNKQQYKTRLVLIGPQHVGKSVVGRIIAQSLSIPFFDTDDLILAANKDKALSIRKLYTILGETKFRREEVRQLSQLSSPYVCATGGGLASNESAWSYMSDIHKKILLVSTAEIVWPRIIDRGIPSYLELLTLEQASKADIERIKEQFFEVFNTRMQFYRKHADIIVDTIGLSPQQVTEKIIASL